MVDVLSRGFVSLLAMLFYPWTAGGFLMVRGFSSFPFLVVGSASRSAIAGLLCRSLPSFLPALTAAGRVCGWRARFGRKKESSLVELMAFPLGQGECWAHSVSLDAKSLGLTTRCFTLGLDWTRRYAALSLPCAGYGLCRVLQKKLSFQDPAFLGPKGGFTSDLYSLFGKAGPTTKSGSPMAAF